MKGMVKAILEGFQVSHKNLFVNIMIASLQKKTPSDSDGVGC
jgi:hypothetical protein